MTALLGAVLGVLVLSVVTSAPAWAHIGLASSSPAQGASIPALPTTLRLDFTGDLQNIAEVVVTGPDGDNLATGEALVDGATVTQPVATAGPGQYALAYRVTSTDGHVLTGRVAFAVGVAFDGTSAATATNPTTSVPTVDGQAPPASTVGAPATASTSWATHDVVVPVVLLALALLAWLLSRRAATHPTSRRTT